MRLLANTALASALILPATSCLADPEAECIGSTQIEIRRCVAETAKRVDKTVEMYLNLARQSADAFDASTGRVSARPALEASQEAWKRFRDAHCEYVGALFGSGSGTGIAINSCHIELGRERAKELKQSL